MNIKRLTVAAAASLVVSGIVVAPIAAASPLSDLLNSGSSDSTSTTTTTTPSKPSTQTESPSTTTKSTTTSSRPSPTTETSVDAARKDVVDLVNAERAKNRCGALKANAKLQEAAQAHTDDMAARNYFDHNSPDGKSARDRINATGYTWSRIGENIARGQQDAAAVVTAWMNSPGHRANILNCDFTEIGVGVKFGSGGPWWTQNFGTPA